MRHTLLLAALAAAAWAQQTIPVNYDESKVGAYTLPDPLVLADGTPVRDARTWTTRRRAELVRLFEDNVYGRSPARPNDQSFEVFDLDRNALGGKAIRKQVTVYFSAKKDGPREDVLIYLPKSEQPVPVILSLNFSGNHTVVADPGVKLASLWDRQTKKRLPAAESSRGSAKDFAGVVENAIARGYGFATIYYGDIDPDFDGGWQFGVRKLFAKPGQTEPEAEDWGALAAWGWGLSRALDYMETDTDINAGRVAILGHSRLGKAVLWAGACDTRFAMVFANCSGEGGASLARRDYGETVKALNTRFPFWFARNHLKFGDHVDQLPVDSHELIALMAPRPVYLATAEDDRWADPKGEFLAATAAGPVYRLLGKRGLDAVEMPPLNQPILSDIGFHYRAGKHEVTAFDWEQYLNFADMHLMLRPDSVSMPGRGLAQHPFLYCGEWQARGRTEQAMHIVREGKVVWSYSIPGREELGDCTRLSNGNIVFSRRLGAFRMGRGPAEERQHTHQRKPARLCPRGEREGRDGLGDQQERSSRLSAVHGPGSFATRQREHPDQQLGRQSSPGGLAEGGATHRSHTGQESGLGAARLEAFRPSVIHAIAR